MFRLSGVFFFLILNLNKIVPVFFLNLFVLSNRIEYFDVKTKESSKNFNKISP